MVRGSLGAVKLLGEDAVHHRYPMYVIKVTDLLELEAWLPHQDLVKAGKMIIVEKDMDVEVLFISHQWTSFAHPDPSGEQLSTLKRVLRRLMEGQTSVRSNSMLEAIYHSKLTISGDEWKRKLPNMYLWVDYFSIPQPGAFSGPKEEEEAPGGRRKSTSTDHRLLFKEGEEVPLDQNADGEVSLAELVSGLKAAVESIPSYIERSSMTWILVPPVKHADLDNTMCDFNSWRSRGWCRMEFAASKLASGDDLPLMVVESEEGTPVFFNPCDTFKLCAAHGNFTVADDIVKVNSTLSTMIENKGASFEKIGDMTLARLVNVFAPVFVPRDGSVNRSVEAPPAFARQPNESAVDALKRRLKWRDEETEAAWVADTGLNLLILACCYDDLDAVNELLATPDKQKLLDGVGKTCNALSQAKVKEGNGPHRKAPMNLCTMQYAHGLTALQAAMTFGTPPTVAALLDAGYDGRRKADGMNCLGMVHCHFKGAIMAGKVDNVKLFLERYPEYINKASANGDTPLHFACFIGKGQSQADMIQTLLDKGADPNKESLFFGPPILAAAQKYDTDPAAIKQLIDAGANVNVRRQPAGAFRPMRAMVNGLGTLFGSVGLKGIGRLLTDVMNTKGRNVLHFASERGDVTMIKTLTEAAPALEVEVKASNKGFFFTDVDAPRKVLPLQVAEEKFGPHKVMKEEIKKVLDEHEAKKPQVAPSTGLQVV